MIHGLPQPEVIVVQQGIAQPVQKSYWRAQLLLASHYATDLSGDGNERLIVDGETWGLGLEWHHTLTDQVNLGLFVPVYRQTAGIMDAGIDGWHDLTGLPDGKRHQRPRDRLLYLYQRTENDETQTAFRLDRDASGLGDLQLKLNWALTPEDTTQWRLGLSAKLPTGSADKFTGSGGYASYLQLQYVDSQLGNRWPLGFSAGLGTGWRETGDILPDLAQHWVGFGHFALDYAYRPGLRLVAQIQGHSSLYQNSGVKLLDPGVSVSGILGLRWLTSGSIWMFSFVEDLHTRTAPDVQFRLSWQPR